MQALVRALDADQDGKVTRGDFVHGHHLAMLCIIRKKFLALSYTIGGQDWGKMFRRFDRSHDGTLSYDEFRHAIRSAKVPVIQGEPRIVALGRPRATGSAGGWQI